MRLTIDDDHPHRFVRDEAPERWEAAGIALRENYNPDGPVVLVGLGKKQRALMGAGRRNGSGRSRSRCAGAS